HPRSAHGNRRCCRSSENDPASTPSSGLRRGSSRCAACPSAGCRRRLCPCVRSCSRERNHCQPLGFSACSEVGRVLESGGPQGRPPGRRGEGGAMRKVSLPKHSVFGAALLGTGCAVNTEPGPAAPPPPPPAVSAQVTVATPPPAYQESY